MSGSVLIVAGEASADLHGAKLMRALKAHRPEVTAFGVGGKHMRAEGFDCVAPAEDMAVAGLTEVLWALPRLLGIARRLMHAARTRRPDVAVLIDHPDFNLRLAKKLRRLGIPVVYYISPQVWAWRQKRVRVIRERVNKMLVILPFEREFYDKHGVPVQFVGHPFVEDLPAEPDTREAREALGLNRESGPVVALLPGSRKKEVTRHLPVMLDAMRLLAASHPNLQALIPVATTIPRALVEDAVQRSGFAARVIEGQSTRVLSAADAAVVCSGTATLQAALLRRPMVVVYRVSWLTYQILRRMVKVAYIAIVNLIAGRALVPELIQDRFTPQNVATEIGRLLDDTGARDTLAAELGRLRTMLGEVGASERVAAVIMEYLPGGAAPRAVGTP